MLDLETASFAGRGTLPAIVLPMRKLGLGNRLRVLASAVQLAAETHRVLYVQWFATHDCNATLQQLFDFGSGAVRDGPAPFQLYGGGVRHDTQQLVVGPLQTLEQRRVKLRALHHTGNIMTKKQFRTFAINEANVRCSDNCSAYAGAGANRDVVVLQTTAFFKLFHVSCHEYARRKSALYRWLAEHAVASVREPLNRAVAGLDSPFSRGLVVGVHVRVDDSRFDYPVIPPQSTVPDGERPRALGWKQACPIEIFVRAAREIRAALPRARFLMLSNDVAAHRLLEQAVGDEGLALPSTWWESLGMGLKRNSASRADTGAGSRVPAGRDSAVGMRRALLEWLLLAHTALILHPYRSSFGEEATFVNLVPSVQLKHGGHVLGGDISHPNCNNHVFAAHEGGLVPAYRSGGKTPPDRFCNHSSVCTQTTRLQRCESFTASWGMHDGFC